MLTEIARFEALAAGESTAVVDSEKPLGGKERTNYLNIIAAMLKMLVGSEPERKSEAEIIRELESDWDHKPGISKANLQNKFALAKRSFSQ